MRVTAPTVSVKSLSCSVPPLIVIAAVLAMTVPAVLPD